VIVIVAACARGELPALQARKTALAALLRED
jgi:hypothetical protein